MTHRNDWVVKGLAAASLAALWMDLTTLAIYAMLGAAVLLLRWIWLSIEGIREELTDNNSNTDDLK